MQPIEKRIYPLFVALTRPPMTMGVTQIFFVVNLMASMILFLIILEIAASVMLAILIAVGSFFIFQILGVVCCTQDDRFIEVLFGRLNLTCKNKSIWGCHSYDPH